VMQYAETSSFGSKQRMRVRLFFRESCADTIYQNSLIQTEPDLQCGVYSFVG
jgi:hypothetical protein